MISPTSSLLQVGNWSAGIKVAVPHSFLMDAVLLLGSNLDKFAAHVGAVNVTVTYKNHEILSDNTISFSLSSKRQ